MKFIKNHIYLLSGTLVLIIIIISLITKIKLNNNARMQMEALKNNKNIKDLELLENQINDKILIENK